MTQAVGLELVWAEAGGTTDPTDSKYQLGWVAEIPTFQNFNYVLQNLDKAKLSYAEGDIYPWQDKIAYVAGARVVRNEKTFYCVTPHNDFAGTNPQDPELDVNGSYWVNGVVFSGLADAFTNLKPKEGVKVDVVQPRNTTNKWEGNDLTVLNKNCVIALNSTEATEDNLLLTNVRGKIAVVNVGNSIDPDERDLLPSANVDSFEFYHEGHKPTQEEVEGTIPDAPANGVAHVRKDGNWVANESIDSVNPLTTTGEAIVGGIVNQFRNSGSFTVPAAGSVDVNTVLYLELTDTYSNRTPTVTAADGDLFRNSTGTDNVLNFIGPAFLELVSDGVSEWVAYERASDGINGINGTDATQSLIPQTISGTLLAGGIINQIRDSGTFNLPLASSVEINTILVVELPERYKTERPLVLRTGTDLIADSTGTDTSITWLGEAKLTLASDGVSTWSL